MLRRILIGVGVGLVFILVLVFASLNPGKIELDLAFASVSPSLAVAFSIAIAFGWVFGVVCCSGQLLRMMAERRKLKKTLQLAESEVSSLRSLPLQDAD